MTEASPMNTNFSQKEGIWLIVHPPLQEVSKVCHDNDNEDPEDDSSTTQTLWIRKQEVQHRPSSLVLYLEDPVVYLSNNGISYNVKGDIVPTQVLQSCTVTPLHTDLIPILPNQSNEGSRVNDKTETTTTTQSLSDMTIKEEKCETDHVNRRIGKKPEHRPPGTLANGTWHVQTLQDTSTRWVYREVDENGAHPCERFYTEDGVVIYPPRDFLDPRPELLATTCTRTNDTKETEGRPPPPGTLAGGAWYIQHLKRGGRRWIYESKIPGTTAQTKFFTQEGVEVCPPHDSLTLVVPEKNDVDITKLPKGLVKGPAGTIPGGKWFQQKYAGAASQGVANASFVSGGFMAYFLTSGMKIDTRMVYFESKKYGGRQLYFDVYGKCVRPSHNDLVPLPTEMAPMGYT